MSYPQPHAAQAVTYSYRCFYCGHNSTISGQTRSPYPTWQLRLKCKQCGTQLMEGSWQEWPDSYGM
jgi:predicted SprT family Zn-dependent metalloprotease